MRKNLKKGFTLIEILIVIGIIGILAVTLLVAINPSEAQKKSRDAKRLRDLSTLSGIMTQIMSADKASSSTCLTSTVGCTSDAAPANFETCSGSSNWLKMDVCPYTATIPTDPTNGTTLRTIVSAGTTAQGKTVYRARITGSDYIITVRSESEGNRNYVTSDGGTLSSWVEAGSNLTAGYLAD